MYFMYHVLYSIACYNPATGCYMIIYNSYCTEQARSVWSMSVESRSLGSYEQSCNCPELSYVSVLNNCILLQPSTNGSEAGHDDKVLLSFPGNKNCHFCLLFSRKYAWVQSRAKWTALSITSFRYYIITYSGDSQYSLCKLIHFF